MRNGILSGPIDLDPKKTKNYPIVPVLPGDVLRHRPTGTTGRLVKFMNDRLQLDVGGKKVVVPIVKGTFEVNGTICTPVVGKRDTPAAPVISSSGSITAKHEARVAKASRILVEGIHDAELLEKVWGDDLRHEGIVIERLDGMDDLSAVVREFGPSPTRRLGILLDHLVPGSKEQRAADSISDSNVLITGTPYVDVWEAVRPSVAGIDAWPQVPMGESWKEGVLARLGHPELHPGTFWKALLGRVTTYADLFPPLVGAVEQLIDFVCEVED